MSVLSLNGISLEGIADKLAENDIRSNRIRLLLRMAVAVRGGMTPADFLSALADAESENGRDAYARIYKGVESKLRSGQYAVYEALHELTTADDRCFLYAEGKVRELSELLQMAHDTAKRKKIIVASVMKPFALPLYLFVMACGILILGGTVMLPNFVPMIPVAQWEFPSRVVYYVGQFLMKHWPIFLVVVGGGVSWIGWSLPNLHSEFRLKYLDRIFPWSLYKSLQSSSFILNIAGMLKAKVAIKDAVTGYSEVATPYAAEYSSRMCRRLESEQTSSDMRALDVGFIDRNTMDSMRILNNKLETSVVVQTIGEAEFEQLADEVSLTASQISRGVNLVIALILVFSLYGTMAVVPTMTEKMLSSARK